MLCSKLRYEIDYILLEGKDPLFVAGTSWLCFGHYMMGHGNLSARNGWGSAGTSKSLHCSVLWYVKGRLSRLKASRITISIKDHRPEIKLVTGGHEMYKKRDSFLANNLRKLKSTMTFWQISSFTNRPSAGHESLESSGLGSSLLTRDLQ